MKAQIELKSTLYKEASAEAERAGYSLDEWVEAAIASQLKKSEELRRFVSEKSKGASKAKARSALRDIRQWADLPPVEGDELPA